MMIAFSEEEKTGVYPHMAKMADDHETFFFFFFFFFLLFFFF